MLEIKFEPKMEMRKAPFIRVTAIPYTIGAFIPYWIGAVSSPDGGVAMAIIMCMLALNRTVDWI